MIFWLISLPSQCSLVGDQKYSPISCPDIAYTITFVSHFQYALAMAQVLSGDLSLLKNACSFSSEDDISSYASIIYLPRAIDPRVDIQDTGL